MHTQGLIRATALCALMALAGAAPQAAMAKMYKWKDAEGVTHYTQTPPPKDAQQGEQMKVHTGTKVTPRRRGKDFYCGQRRLPTLSDRAASAISRINSSMLSWEDQIERIRENKAEYVKQNAKQATTTRFNDRLRGFDEQVAEYQCQLDWGKASLAELDGEKSKILEHHAKLEALQAEVQERKLASCGAGRTEGVVIVDDAYRRYQQCIRPFDRELRKLRNSLRRSNSDVKLVSD